MDKQHQARNSRRDLAEDTLRILERGGYDLHGVHIDIGTSQGYAEAHTLLYSPEQGGELVAGLPPSKHAWNTQFEVTGETTLDAVRRLVGEGEVNPVCLNFASAKNPGGGFLGGAQAQEESIARASGLYPCLLRAPLYYSSNRSQRSCLYTDYVIYSPEVPVFRLEDGTLMEKPVLCAVITAPAPNAGVVRQQERKRVPEIAPTLQRRMAIVLAVAAAQGHETIVLGAWGCGVFQNDPAEVAGLFHVALRGPFAGRFRRVVFAVYAKEPRFVTPFRELFG